MIQIRNWTFPLLINSLDAHCQRASRLTWHNALIYRANHVSAVKSLLFLAAIIKSTLGRSCGVRLSESRVDNIAYVHDISLEPPLVGNALSNCPAKKAFAGV
jgi:hypothetical protein